jgi:hypothetical protein
MRGSTGARRPAGTEDLELPLAILRQRRQCPL